MKTKRIIAGVMACGVALSSILHINCISSEKSVITANAVVSNEIPDGYTPIYDIEDLYNVRNNLGGNYILMNDIDLSETAPGGDWDTGNGWEPIGNLTDGYFHGIFDGNGYQIKNMNIYGEFNEERSHLGLFGCVEGAEIKNTGLVDININTNISNGITMIGGLVAESREYSSHIRTTKISNSYCSGNISVRDINDKVYSIGSIVSFSRDTEIYNCFNYADISLDTSLDTSYEDKIYVGGILGSMGAWNYGTDSLINCSYNFGNISCSNLENVYVGAVSGFITSYFDNNTNSVYYLNNNSYTAFDIQSTYGGAICNISDSDVKYCKGLTPAMAKTTSAYNFDFENTWEIDKYCVNYPYPQLKSNPYIAVESIELISLPNKLSYYQNEVMDLTGAKLLIKYEDGTEAEAPLTSDMITADTSISGLQNVIVNYRTGQTSFEIEVSSQGDVNGDGLINSSDASDTLAEYALISSGYQHSFKEEQIKSADVNNDDVINSSDASSILAFYAYTSSGGGGTIEDFLFPLSTDETYIGIVTSETADIKMDMDENSETLKTLSVEEKVNVLEVYDEWYLISSGSIKGYISSNSLKSALKDYLNIYYDKYIESPDMSTVMEYDINSDGTKEVIIRTGEYASDMLYSIYTAQNGEAMWIGDIGASHSVLYYDENGRLLKQIAHMNCETVYAISVINGTIIETELYSNGMVDSYSVPGIKLESYFLSEFFETIEE